MNFLRIYFNYFFIFLSLLLLSCSSGTDATSSPKEGEVNQQRAESNEPAAVAVAYITAMMHGHSHKAKAYTTEASHIYIDRLSAMVAIDPDFSVTAIKDSISGSHAFVTLQHEQEEPMTVHLVKIEGQWKLDLIATSKDEQKRKQQQWLEKMKSPPK